MLAVLGTLGVVALLEVLGVFVALRDGTSRSSPQSSSRREVPLPSALIAPGESPPSAF